MRASFFIRCLIFAATIGVVSCGGYNPPSSPSPNPSPSPSPSPSPGAAGQVEIVGQQGANSFTPNPSAPGTNGAVTWMNDDNTTHRIVANDGSFDTGNIAPGSTSQAMAVPAAGARYHCSLHPTMVGVVNNTGGGTPPCTGQYC